MNQKRVIRAQKIMYALGLPAQQRTEMSALCLLALLNLRPPTKWADAQAPLLDVTGLLNWIWENYKAYPPSARDRLRQTMRELVAAGLALSNPDKPDRSIHSSAFYQIDPPTLALLRAYHPRLWQSKLNAYLSARASTTPSD